MKRKLFTFLMAFLATLSGAVWAQDYTGTIDISGNAPTITSGEDDISVDGKHIEISGDGNYLIKGDGTAKDYYIKVSGDPTITLQDVYLKHEDDPIMEINIRGGGDVKLILIGTNTFESDEEIGIRSTAETNVTILDSSTGILTFKTNIGIGNNSGMVGDVAINGGTVVFDTKEDAISGTVGGAAKHDFTMNGNGVMITNKGFDNIDHNFEEIESGIIFDNTASWPGNHTGLLRPKSTNDKTTEFTLNSPLDLTDNDLTAALDLQGGTLTVGENGVLNAESGDIRNGKISGFSIKYEANRISGCSSTGTSLPTDYNFYPPKGEVTLGAALTCNASTEVTETGGKGKHQFLGWIYNNKVYEAGTTITMDEAAKTYTVDEYGNISGSDFVTLKGAWAVEEITLTINNYMPMTDHTLASSADIISYETVTEGLPTGIKCENGKFSGTANLDDTDFGDQDSKEYTVTVPIKADGTTEKTATVKIIVNKTIPDLANAVASVKTGQDYIYNGEPKDAVTVSVNDKSLTEGIHYTVTYTWKKNSEDAGSEVTEVIEAGTYTVKSITAGDQATGTYSNTLPTEAITVKPRELNLQIKDQEIELEETIATPSSDNIEARDNDSDENDYFINDHTGATITYSGTLTAGTIDKAGKYTLSKGEDFAIASITAGETDVTHNYTLGDVNTGTLIVTKDLGEEGEDQGGPEDDDTDVKIDDDTEGGWKWSAEDGAYVRKYDGTTHSLDVDGLIKVRQENGDDDWVAVPADKMGISYEYTKPEGSTSLANTGDPKNVGSYVATITISEDAEGIYVKGNAKIKLKITEADLTVDLKLESITWAQMGNPKDLLVVGNFGLTYDPESLSSTEGDAVKSSLSSALEKVTATATADENKETATITINGLKLVDTESFYADNYNVAWKNGDATITPGEGGSLEIGGIDITPETPEDEDLTPAVDGDEDDWKWNAENGAFERTYDGEAHNLTSLKIKNLYNSGYSTINVNEGYTVSYTYCDTKEGTYTDLGEEDVQKAGYYKASITLSLTEYEPGPIEMLLYIAKADLSVDLNLPNTITVEEAENLSTWWSADDAEVNAVNEAESKAASVSGTASINDEADLTPGGKVTVSIANLKIEEEDPFSLSNYNNPTWNGASVTDGSATVEITIVDDDPDYPGGEVTPGDEDGDDDTWTWDVNKEAFTHVYDGHVHSIETIIITKDGTSTTLNVGEDFGISGIDNMKNVGKYPAVITFNNPATYGFATIQMPLEITKRPMKVDFNLPSSVSSLASQKVDDADVDYELQSEAAPAARGLLNDDPDETYPIISDNAQFVFTKTANDKCKVTLKGFLLQENPLSGFDPDNYQLQIWDATKGYHVDYNNDGSDITIVDPDGPNEDQNPNLPEDGDGNIDYNPGGSGDDDDDNDHGHGGSDINRPAKYYNMYVDSAATCDGVELWFNKNVVREGNQASVYVKIEEGYDAEHMKLWFKRSLYGYWEELEEGVQPGEYIIYNVYTDIYVKATDVEKDPTGIEEIEGVKVYAQNGSIYVYTPNRLPVWIVSMTGAVVRNEEQVGLQQYDRLNQGIYIVRVGEQVFKIRL